MSYCQFSQKLWTQKNTNRNWGQTIIYQSPSCFAQEEKNLRFFCITVDIFLLIPFLKHMVEHLSCFFPTYLPWKCTEHKHEARADSWGVKPSSLIHSGSHFHCIPLGASRENLLHKLRYPWDRYSVFLGREEWMEVVCQQ